MCIRDSLGTGGVQEKLEETITSASATSGNTGADITMSGASSTFTSATNLSGANVAIHANGGAPGEAYNRGLISSYSNFTSSPSQKKINNIGNTGTNSSGLVNQKTTVVNAIALGSNSTGFSFINRWVNIRKNGKKKKRGLFGLFKIDAFSSNVAKLGGDISADDIPDNSDFWEIFSSNSDDGPWDARITTNPALHLLEYLTNDRYGRELDIDADIDLESFLEAAKDCDTRSDVNIVTKTQATVGAFYHYQNSSNKTLWFGKVKSSTAVSMGGSTLYNTVFTDVGGKIAHRWESWKYFYAGELYYYEGGLHQASSSGVISSTPSTTSSKTTLVLSKIDTSGTVEVDLTHKSFDGNRVVKIGVANSTTAAILPNGYSLYDSDNVKYWRYLGWEAQNQRYVTRHQANTVLDTSRPLFENVNSLLAHFNGILRYSGGRYSLSVRKASEDVNTYTVDGITHLSLIHI